jgi:hypothetical protein
MAANVTARHVGALLRWLIALVIAGTVLLGWIGSADAASAPTWWKVDTHQHSAFSGDARADLGLDAAIDKSLNYSAVFVTDHDRLNSFSIQGANGNYLDYRDALSGRWLPKTLGSTSSSTNAVVTSPVHSGANSLHLAVTSSSASNGRTFVYAKRGANLLSGDVTLDFWVYPLRIDPGSGVDVSVSLGRRRHERRSRLRLHDRRRRGAPREEHGAGVAARCRPGNHHHANHARHHQPVAVRPQHLESLRDRRDHGSC